MSQILIPRVTKIRKSSQDNKNTTNSENSPKTMEIQPKKLINPVKNDDLRREVHRELLFFNRVGTSPLDKKSELQKTIEKIKTKETAKEIKEASDFDKMLQKRKQVVDGEQEKAEENVEEEFQRVRRMISGKGGE